MAEPSSSSRKCLNEQDTLGVAYSCFDFSDFVSEALHGNRLDFAILIA